MRWLLGVISNSASGRHSTRHRLAIAVSAIACGAILLFVARFSSLTSSAANRNQSDADAVSRRAVFEVGGEDNHSLQDAGVVRADADARRRQSVKDPLRHDFGVVPPGAVVSWDYPVHNSSKIDWTIEKVHVLCRCTVPSVSAPVIAPGEQEMVTVKLDCGEDVADIAKAVTVQFKEADAPPVRLLIKASVRAPMTPSVREVSFGGVAVGDRPEQAIALSNYSGADWRELRVESCPPWAEIAIAHHRAEPGPPNAAMAESTPSKRPPRQIWQAVVRLTGKDLTEGYHQAPVVVRSNTDDECQMHLTVRLEPPVRIVPEKLVFGPAGPGESCVRVARVIVQKRAGVANVKAHIEAGSLSVAVRKLNEATWELRATLAVPPNGQAAGGEIRLSFPGTSLADAALRYSFFSLLPAR